MEPDPPLSPEQLARVAELSIVEIELIDETLLANACAQNRKVAFLVGSAMIELKSRIPRVPDIYYAQRVKGLVERGLLQAKGNLSYMRYSEVRLSEIGNE